MSDPQSFVNRILDLLINYPFFLLSISIHESAHAYSANKLGDPTGKYHGRISLNPMRHIDIIGTVLFPAIAYLSNFPLIGWAKPCPVNPYYFKNPKRDNMIVAACGPASNMLFAILISVIFVSAKYFFMYKAPLMADILIKAIFLNIILALFNLVPMAPLDGGWILEAFLPSQWERSYERIKPFGFLIVLVLFYAGAISLIMMPIALFILSILTGERFY